MARRKNECIDGISINPDKTYLESLIKDEDNVKNPTITQTDKIKNIIKGLLTDKSYINYDSGTVGGKKYIPTTILTMDYKPMLYYWTCKEGFLVYISATENMKLTASDDFNLSTLRGWFADIIGEPIESMWVNKDPDILKIYSNKFVSRLKSTIDSIEQTQKNIFVDIEEKDALELIKKYIKERIDLTI